MRPGIAENRGHRDTGGGAADGNPHQPLLASGPDAFEGVREVRRTVEGIQRFTVDVEIHERVVAGMIASETRQ